MKRAFDALPKPLLVFSWIRMGMPEDLAEYLVAMDWGGHSLVRSPLVMSTVVEEGFEKAIEDDLIFDADVASPLNWDAAFDRKAGSSPETATTTT